MIYAPAIRKPGRRYGCPGRFEPGQRTDLWIRDLSRRRFRLPGGTAARGGRVASDGTWNPVARNPMRVASTWPHVTTNHLDLR